jgi:hypothetical protein
MFPYISDNANIIPLTHRLLEARQSFKTVISEKIHTAAVTNTFETPDRALPFCIESSNEAKNPDARNGTASQYSKVTVEAVWLSAYVFCLLPEQLWGMHGLLARFPAVLQNTTPAERPRYTMDLEAAVLRAPHYCILRVEGEVSQKTRKRTQGEFGFFCS